MSNKVKGRKMDANTISNQIWELRYVANKFGVLVENVKSAKKQVGRSRRKVYTYIRENY